MPTVPIPMLTTVNEVPEIEVVVSPYPMDQEYQVVHPGLLTWVRKKERGREGGREGGRGRVGGREESKGQRKGGKRRGRDREK